MRYQRKGTSPNKKRYVRTNSLPYWDYGVRTWFPCDHGQHARWRNRKVGVYSSGWCASLSSVF